MVTQTRLNVTLYVHCLYCCLLHSVQSGSVAHPDSYSVRIDGSFPWDKAVGALSQSLNFIYCRKLRIHEAIPTYPIDLHGVVLN
jgi:hypothetical protein